MEDGFLLFLLVVGVTDEGWFKVMAESIIRRNKSLPVTGGNKDE